MSRTFSKILVICAMVVVLPLMVAGTVLAAYHSIDSVVNVGVVFVNDEKVENSGDVDVYAAVKYGDKTAESIKIVKSHKQTATVSANYSHAAYEFMGWFMGDAETYKQKVGVTELIGGDDLTFDMATASNIVAVYQINTFTISYSGEEAPTEPKTEVKYGEKLADPKSKTDATMEEGKCYRGWLVNGDESAKRYKYATFDAEGPFTLENPLDERKSFDLTLKKGESQQTYKAYVEDQDGNSQTVDLSSIDLDDIFGVDTEKDGYSYSWTDDQGHTVGEVTLTEAKNFTLNEEKIEYKANVTKGENVTDEVSANVTFTVDEYQKITDLFNLKGKYSFFKVKEIKVDESETYTGAEAFVSAFVAQHKHETATANIFVDVESEYSKITVDALNFKAYEDGQDGDDGSYTGTVYNSEGKNLGGPQKPSGWEAANTSVVREENVSIYDLFDMLTGDGVTLKKFYSDDEQTAEIFVEQIFVKIKSDSGLSFSVTLDLDANPTIYDLMEAILTAKRSIDGNGDYTLENDAESGFHLESIDVLFK